MGIEIGLLAALGALVPFLAAIANKVQWSSKTKQLVVWGFSIVVALGWTIGTGGIGSFGFATFFAAAPTVYALSQAIYEFIGKGLFSKLEAATRKGAVVVTPLPSEDGVVTKTDELTVTTTETVKAADTTDAAANVVVDGPVNVAPVEPRG